MSVQLVLYPQNYKGRYSSVSTPVFNQYVADNMEEIKKKIDIILEYIRKQS